MKIINTYDLHSFILKENYNCLNIVDLGYNNGSFIKNLQDKGIILNQIVAVEPLKQFKAHMTGIVLINKLIGLVSGDYVDFYVQNNLLGASSTNFKTKDSTIIKCETITLQDLYEQNNVEKVDLLKIDIEGTELKILNLELIEFLSKNTSQICVEFHDWLDDKKESTLIVENIYRLFKKNNFYIFKFSLNNGSVLFINKSKFDIHSSDKINLYINKYLMGVQRVFKRFFLYK